MRREVDGVRTEKERLENHDAAERLGDWILDLLPDGKPLLCLKACAYLVGALAANADEDEGIPSPEEGLPDIWLEAADVAIRFYYDGCVKQLREDDK